MKQSILYIVMGALVIIGGLRYNEYRLIPEFLYYVFGGTLIVFGIYKLVSTTSDDQKNN